MARNPRDTRWVRRLPNEYVGCRTMRHAWEQEFFGLLRDAPVPRPEATPFRTSYVRVLGCGRCGTRRVDFFGPYHAGLWERFRTRYIYPEGYRYHVDPAGPERPGPVEYLREEYRRTKEGQ